MKTRARKRELQLKGVSLPTPLVVPSFSSRVKPPDPLQNFLKRLLPAISGPLLISAYDVHHRPGLADYDFNVEILIQDPFLVFLDSGGYEVIWNDKAQLAGVIQGTDAPTWQLEDYIKVLEGWPESVPLVAVTFDNPEPPSMEEQIAAATDIAFRFPHFSIDCLLKPPRGKPKGRETTLELSDIEPFVRQLKGFPLIGVTEKEIGASMKDRLSFLVGFRDLLDNAGLETPIHVFGGLDPLMTPLYFLAGADVFDGLSWLRYGFKDGRSLYDQGFVATEDPLMAIEEAIWGMRLRNIGALTDLEVSMNKHLLGSGIQEAFHPHGNEVQSAWDRIWAVD
ncbi:MAG: hypothetical protein JKY94_08745 [Rhodobacteraceae bacterium]|nr:hypothetical protein [Paracoccaceae bacterium]